MDDTGSLTPNDFDLIDDVKLMGFGESDSSGAWIKLQILPEQLDKFRGLKGEIFETTMRQLANDGKPVKAPVMTKKYGRNAQILYKSGFFYNIQVVEQIGTDAEYQDWCREQPCIICRQFGEVVQDGLKHAGEGRNVYAHVLRAGRPTSGGRGAGSNKPIYSGVSMCNHHHTQEHKHGSLYVYNQYCELPSNKRKKTANASVAKGWFEERAGGMLADWAHSKLATDFGYSSLSQVPPKKIIEWVSNSGLKFHLPAGFTTQE